MPYSRPERSAAVIDRMWLVLLSSARIDTSGTSGTSKYRASAWASVVLPVGGSYRFRYLADGGSWFCDPDLGNETDSVSASGHPAEAGFVDREPFKCQSPSTLQIAASK